MKLKNLVQPFFVDEQYPRDGLADDVQRVESTALTSEETCVSLAKLLASAKVEGQYRYLMRAGRGDEESRAAIQISLDSIQPLLGRIADASSRDTLCGLEGTAAVHYFAALRQLMGTQVVEEFKSDSRSRRPPLDRFNVALSFVYGLVHAAVMRSILAVDPQGAECPMGNGG